MRALRWFSAVAAACGLPLLVMVGSAGAASCAQVAVNPGVQGPVLSPVKATITAGGCVAYTDNTPFAVKVTVGKVSGSADPNSSVTFREPVAGTFTVTARESFQGQPVGNSGSGSLVVTPAPRPSPSRSPSPQPQPHPSASSTAPRPSSSTSTGPQVAPSFTPPPPTAPGVSPSVTLPPPGPGQQPVIIGMPPPTPSPSSSAAAVVGELQPPSGRGVGLPAAVAALLLAGAAGAFVRVLLAEPVRTVDSGRFVVGSP